MTEDTEENLNLSGGEQTDNSYESQPTIFDELGKLDQKDIVKVMEKADRIQKKKDVIINDPVAEAKKGRCRNERCPMCLLKAKNCSCDHTLIADKI